LGKSRRLESRVNNFDLAETEWRRITSIAIPTLAGISTIQALLAEPVFQTWQAQLLIGNVLLALFGFLMEGKYQTNFSFLPLYLFMLAAPVIFGNQPSNSWMSIGLVCMAANIHIAGIQRVQLAIVSVLLITAYQCWVAFQNYPSVSDNDDIQYFYSYFASIWMLAIGFGTIYIRRRYLKVAHNVREVVERSLEDSLSSFNAIKRANLEDSNNIQLHGTVLNTLIYFKNLPAKSHTHQEIKSIITKDLSHLKSRLNPSSSEEIRGKIIELLATRSRRRIEVTLKEIPGHIEDKEIENGLVEIIRELLLNLEKHTSATYCIINIFKVNPSRILVSMEANSIKDFNAQEIKSEISASIGSLSLQRLMSSFGGEFKVSSKPNSSELSYELSVPERSLRNTLQETLIDVRYAGLNDFAINFARVSSIVGLFHLLGFAASGMETIHLVLIGLFNVLQLSAIQIPKSRLILIFSTTLSLLIIPTIAYGVQDCDNVLILPWVFNSVLAQGFLVALRVRVHALKWLPLAILALQSFVYPQNFDVACRNIFAGSIPAIPLIAVLAFTILRIREREFDLDQEQSRSVAKMNYSSGMIESDLNREYEFLVEELDVFASNQDFSLSSDDIQQVYELQIQKIRNYLICAEQFESLFVQNLYYFAKERGNNDLITRLSIHGSLPLEGEIIGDISALFNHLKREFEGREMHLTVIASSSIEVVVDLSEVNSQLDSLNFGKIHVKFEPLSKP
jgi:hypothetical protein